MEKIKKLNLSVLFHHTEKFGFTLIELIIGIVIGIIIILTIGYGLAFSNKVFKNQISEYNLTREGSFAISFIERKLRDKKPESIEIIDSGKKIMINSEYICQNEGNLVYFDGRKENVLIKEIIEEIYFEKEKNDLIKIKIILTQDNFSKIFETKVKLRN
jgi:competence protein ComGC